MATNYYATAEAWIKAEWSWVRANVALHPYWSLLGAGVLGAVLGHIL